MEQMTTCVVSLVHTFRRSGVLELCSSCLITCCNYSPSSCEVHRGWSSWQAEVSQGWIPWIKLQMVLWRKRQWSIFSSHSQNILWCKQVYTCAQKSSCQVRQGPCLDGRHCQGSLQEAQEWEGMLIANSCIMDVDLCLYFSSHLFADITANISIRITEEWVSIVECSVSNTSRFSSNISLFL